jgi:phospholipid/cholesterol/gamma-HCH transport system substrate-binding protein
MENKSYAFAAGLFALLLGMASLLAVYWLNGSRDAVHDYVVVTKQNIGGLNPQAQVRLRITAISWSPFRSTRTFR